MDLKILRNAIADFFSRNANRPVGVGGSSHTGWISSIAAPDSVGDEALVSRAMVMSRILEIVRNDFTERNWKAFELMKFGHLTSEEVGLQLGMTANAVRQAVHRILKRIQEEGQGMLD